MKRRICVVTGTRADYGHLYWLMKRLQDDSYWNLQIVATGMHLSPEFGLTYREIEKDGFQLAEKVEMMLSSDTAVGIAKSIGLGVIGFADALERLRPDVVVLLGDRYEIFAAAQAAMAACIPIAHIAGGDTTEGAIDEAIRHGITKMAHLHFVSNEISRKRVVQMGENPLHVYNVGEPSLEHLRHMTLLSRKELEIELGMELRKKNLLITFHPVTLEEDSAGCQFGELLKALDMLGEEVGLIFTKPNADTGGRIIIDLLEEYVAAKAHAKAFVSLGQLRYFSAMAQVDAVVGNSSSGLYEAPAFHKPTVNIGDRQKGRLQADSVLNCPPDRKAIHQRLIQAFTMDCSHVVSPYGSGDSSELMIAELKKWNDYRPLLKKRFFSEGECYDE